MYAKRYPFIFLTFLSFLIPSTKVSGQGTQNSLEVSLSSLASFKNPGESWHDAADVYADLNKQYVLSFTNGSGILVNLTDKKNTGSDLISNEAFGDIDLELDYMIAKGSNSGIYIQGMYEIQIEDSWTEKVMTHAKNGGIFERWDDSRPNGMQGYEGYAPRQNASRAPGLWQHLKVEFAAPRFDATGKKASNAKIISLVLNGVMIHENIELFGPTRGAMGNTETAFGPIRLQGDHGSVAFRNISVKKYLYPRIEKTIQAKEVDPILLEAQTNTILRSFMDMPGSTRVVHAVSVGSPQQVHYTYDLDKGTLLQVWRGGFLNATPMWHERGDGSSRPLGAVLRFGTPALTLAKLSSTDVGWIPDTTGSNYRPKGYVLDTEDIPSFKYQIGNTSVTDAIRVLNNGEGISREITIQNAVPDMFVRIAQASKIEKQRNGTYIIGDKSYYLRLDDTSGAKAIIRDSQGSKELILPIQSKLNYSILF